MANLLLLSCSDNTLEAPVVFPEKQVIDVKAGETKTMTFTAPAAHWELISEQPVWCRLTFGDQKALPSVVGEEGSVTLTVNISDDMSSYIEKSTADLTLRIGTQEQVIATIVRADIDTYVVLKHDGEIIPPGGEVVIDSDGETTITVETNFGTPDTKHSQWFDVSGDDGVYSLALKDGISQKYSIPSSEGYIDFTLIESRAILDHDYTVSFTGMDPNVIKFTGYVYTPEGSDISYKLPAFNWQVSPDGRTMTTTRANGDIVTATDAMPVTVDALNDDIVFATIDGTSFKSLTGSEWYSVAQDKSNVSICVDPLPATVTSRSAAIYAFSRAQWQETSMATITDEASYSSNAIFSFVQKVESQGFEVTYYDWNEYDMKTLAVSHETSAKVLSDIHEWNPTARDVYCVSTTDVPQNTYTGRKSLTIGSLLSQAEWEVGTDAPNYALLDLTTGENVKDKPDYAIDPGMDVGNKWQFDVSFPGDLSSPLLLVMYQGNSVLKVLVIKV